MEKLIKYHESILLIMAGIACHAVGITSYGHPVQGVLLRLIALGCAIASAVVYARCRKEG